MSPHVGFETRRFRDALGAFPTGVVIVTTATCRGRPLGLTCNSFSSVSLDPPLVSWSLRRESPLLPEFRRAGHFAIHVLSEDQQGLSTRFASRVPDRFEDVPYTDGILGSPLIQACGARFECSLYQAHEAGDHILFLGRVERFDEPDHGDALVFHRGSYRELSRPPTP